jgi:hypothetical protein
VAEEWGENSGVPSVTLQAGVRHNKRTDFADVSCAAGKCFLDLIIAENKAG